MPLAPDKFQSFVRDALDDPNDAEIIRAIVAMTRSLGPEVFAEGVEQQAQLDLLQLQGCDLYQRYLFSRPLPLTLFTALLTKRLIANAWLKKRPRQIAGRHQSKGASRRPPLPIRPLPMPGAHR